MQRSKANPPSAWAEIPSRDTALLSPSLDYVSVRTTEFGQGGRENEEVVVRSQSSSSTPPCRRRLEVTADESEVDESAVGVSIRGEVRSFVQHFVRNNSIQMAIAGRP